MSMPLTLPKPSLANPIQARSREGKVLPSQRARVNRYVTGKRPEYAPESSSETEDEDDFIATRTKEEEGMSDEDEEVKAEPYDEEVAIAAAEDRRLRRLRQRDIETTEIAVDEDERIRRHQRLQAPELLQSAVADVASESEDEDTEQMDDAEIERRRSVLRDRAARRRAEEEVELMQIEEEQSDAAEGSESDEEIEYTDEESGDEDGPTRLKPVFVRKRERQTIVEREREARRKQESEQQAKRAAEDRARDSRKLVENLVRKEVEAEQLAALTNPSRALVAAMGGVIIPKSVEQSVEQGLMSVRSDDEEEDDEAAYEAWKLRELRRIKRDRDEREAEVKEREELERVHGLTDEQRRNEFKANPKQVTNKASKGKYKFLQKYYHRGAFFLDGEEDVFKRDVAQPTLEDHFDKTVLPQVMQVKNFGMAGRTKYTHLVDQDTTDFASPWISETAQNLRFFTGKGGGTKQVFNRPGQKKQRDK